MKPKAFLPVAVALFLLFVGVSAYPLLWPVHDWTLICLKRADGRVDTRTGVKGNQVDAYMSVYAMFGRTCTAVPVRRFVFADFLSAP